MALLMTRIQVDDYDAWKPMFDSDPAGARKRAKGHRIARSVDNPDEVFVQVQFASSDEAQAARERLLLGRFGTGNHQERADGRRGSGIGRVLVLRVSAWWPLFGQAATRRIAPSPRSARERQPSPAVTPGRSPSARALSLPDTENRDRRRLASQQVVTKRSCVHGGEYALMGYRGRGAAAPEGREMHAKEAR
jgi:hypothetical protein